jgi:hypothetical protein
MKKMIVLIFTMSVLLSSFSQLQPVKKVCDKFHNESAGWMFLGETESSCIYYVNGENIEIVK